MPHLERLDAAAAGTAPLPQTNRRRNRSSQRSARCSTRSKRASRAGGGPCPGRAGAGARRDPRADVQRVGRRLHHLRRVLLFNRDVTRQQRDEARLREALNDADAANEAKTQFLATVSHEIRTPLNAVSGMSELLLETRLDPEQTGFAKAVHINAEALSMLIGDLLDSSRIEAGQVFLDSAPFDLRELVEGVAEFLVVRAEVKGVELVVDLSPATPRRLVGDRTRLRQVLMNLVGNAVKFTEQGDVTIRAASSLRPRRVLCAWRWSTPASGFHSKPRRGSSNVSSRRIARRRAGTAGPASDSTSRARCVELMGGRLSLQSEPGGGSTFESTMTLPLAPTQPPPDLGPASLAGVDVLVVPANAALREMIAAAPVRRRVGSGGGTAAEAFTGSRRWPTRDRVGERLSDSTGIEVARRVWHDRQGATPAASIVLHVLVARDGRQERRQLWHHRVCLPAGQTGAADSGGAPRRGAGTGGCRDSGPTRRRAAAALGDPPAHPPGRRQPRQLDAGHAHPDRDRLRGRSRRGRPRGRVGRVGARYDLILMDVALPQIDGIEATRRIRAHEADAGGRVPIVALTAHAVDSVRQQALAAGMNDYATKPIEKQQLLDICAKWIDRRPLLLIADDTPDIQVLLANYLRGSDYRLASVVNGQEAVDAVERRGRPWCCST